MPERSNFMSRARRRLLFPLFVAALLMTGTAVSQLAAHMGHCCAEAVTCRPINFITREDCLISAGQTLPRLENGDILITCSTHSFGWRHGHAGLVVDETRGLVLEAQILGSPSSVVPAEHWRRYSTLWVFRLKNVQPEVRQAIADYALHTLNHIPYRLTSGWFGRRADGCLSVQCAYLVWYAYAHFGFDLDSDGGRLVTVADLAASPLLEVVEE